jgi:CDP-diacylglycerol--serine O-phosphatidyltransferase
MLLRIKDLFTIGTIIAGFLVLPFAYVGQFFWASMLILIGSVLDGLDGFYARLTKTGNKFGAEFDVIADLIIYSMAPGILLFFVYKDYNIYFASLVGLLPLLFGCIRLARFNVKRIEYPGYWMGFPRPGSAWAIVAFVNSSLFSMYNLFVVGAVYVFFMGLMNITIVPYMGHHKRKFSKVYKGAFILAGLVAVAGLVFGFFWDALLVYALLYLISPLFIPRKDKKKIKAFIKKWKASD